MTNRIGMTFTRRLPFLPGFHKVKIVARRIPKEGEYMMLLTGGTVYQRKGSAFLSKVDAEREYWIVEKV